MLCLMEGRSLLSPLGVIGGGTGGDDHPPRLHQIDPRRIPVGRRVTCAAQVANGHEVWLAYGPIYVPEGSLLGRARESGARLVEVGPMRRAVLPLHDYRCYRQLSRLVREIRPDVVHTYSSKAGILGRAAAWRERIPAVIHMVHGLPFHDHQPRLVHHAYVAAERWAAQSCHRIIGVTQAMCDAFQRKGIGVPWQFSVIPSGVEVSRLTVLGHERPLCGASWPSPRISRPRNGGPLRSPQGP